MILRYLKKHLKLFFIFAKINLLSSVEYKFSLYVNLILRTIFVTIWILFWGVIFSYTPLLAGWSLGEIIVLTGFSNICVAFFGMFFLGFYSVSDKVMGGQVLERYLTKPVNSLFALLSEEIKVLDSLPQLVLGILTILFACLNFGVNVSPLRLPISFIVLFLGDFALNLIYGSIECASFWVGRVKGLISFLDAFDEFTSYPLDKINVSVRLFLTWGFPSIFLSTYPAMILLGKLDIYGSLNVMIIALSLFLIWLIIFQVFWRKGLRRYESYGG